MSEPAGPVDAARAATERASILAAVKRVPWWVVAGVVVPFGFGGFAAVIPGVQRRKPVWILFGVLASVLLILGLLLHDDGGRSNAPSGVLYIAGWIVSAATVLSIRRPYLELRDRRPSRWESGKRRARARLDERREALAIVQEDPRLATELGIGRPDVPGSQHAGLVDVNHVSAAALAELPGVDAALADRIVTVREEVNGFTSLEDCGAVLDLDGNVVERLRDRAVFLPR